MAWLRLILMELILGYNMSGSNQDMMNIVKEMGEKLIDK